jgi:hypothetical protein
MSSSWEQQESSRVLEFRSLPRHLESGSELRNLLEEAIEKVPTAKRAPAQGVAIVAFASDRHGDRSDSDRGCFFCVGVRFGPRS